MKQPDSCSARKAVTAGLWAVMRQPIANEIASPVAPGSVGSPSFLDRTHNQSLEPTHFHSSVVRARVGKVAHGVVGKGDATLKGGDRFAVQLAYRQTAEALMVDHQLVGLGHPEEQDDALSGDRSEGSSRARSTASGRHGFLAGSPTGSP